MKKKNNKICKSISNKEKIKLKEEIKKYKGNYTPKELDWKRPVGKEIW